MKAIWLDRPLLALRWKAAVASRLAFQHAFLSPRLSEQFRTVADRAKRAANTVEAISAIFGVFLRPGGAR